MKVREGERVRDLGNLIIASCYQERLVYYKSFDIQ